MPYASSEWMWLRHHLLHGIPCNLLHLKAAYRTRGHLDIARLRPAIRVLWLGTAPSAPAFMFATAR